MERDMLQPTIRSKAPRLDAFAALGAVRRRAKRSAHQRPRHRRQTATTPCQQDGLIVDRKESGQPGDFAQLQSIDDVLAAVRQELGEGAAAALVASLEQQDAPATSSSDLTKLDAERDLGEALN
jgi:hypothetical protein